MKNIIIGIFCFSLIMMGTAFAGGMSGVDIFQGKCGACHGTDGEGTAMAPSFEENTFIKYSTSAEIGEVIKQGRNHSDKKYKEFPLPMPSHHDISDKDMTELVKYLKKMAEI